MLRACTSDWRMKSSQEVAHTIQSRWRSLWSVSLVQTREWQKWNTPSKSAHYSFQSYHSSSPLLQGYRDRSAGWSESCWTAHVPELRTPRGRFSASDWHVWASSETYWSVSFLIALDVVIGDVCRPTRVACRQMQWRCSNILPCVWKLLRRRFNCKQPHTGRNDRGAWIQHGTKSYGIPIFFLSLSTHVALLIG